MSQDLINHLLAALLNFSDLHDEFCLACSEAGIVQLFVDMTKDLQDSVPYHAKFVVGIITVWLQVASWEVTGNRPCPFALGVTSPQFSQKYFILWAITYECQKWKKHIVNTKIAKLEVPSIEE